MLISPMVLHLPHNPPPQQPPAGSELLLEVPLNARTPETEHPYLHVVTSYDHVMLDWEGKGSVPCSFDAGGTHVHPDSKQKDI